LTRATPSDNRNPQRQLFRLPDAELHYWPTYLAADQANRLQQQLAEQLNWQRARIRLYGREVAIPRRQVWMGEPHCRYRYSGTDFLPEPWHPLLQQLAQRLSQTLQQPFNCVLLNQYADGQDHMGWHADDEPELGEAPQIASLSLGQSRRFDLKHRQLECQLQLQLQHGSLLFMAGACQQYWQHRLPKQAQVKAERINLTFRYIALR
jgi:alkylated DNA repair dioxygenase AlkB